MRVECEIVLESKSGGKGREGFPSLPLFSSIPLRYSSLSGYITSQLCLSFLGVARTKAFACDSLATNRLVLKREPDFIW